MKPNHPKSTTVRSHGRGRPGSNGTPPADPVPLEREDLGKVLEELRREVRDLRTRLDSPVRSDPSLASPPAPAPDQPAPAETVPILPLRSRLSGLQVLAPRSSVPTRALPAREAFEMRVALEVGGSAGAAAGTVCHVSVSARRLGEGESWIVGQATQSLAPATETLGILLGGLPLPPGLYRFEASASLRLRGDGRGPGSTYLDGGLIRVF